MEKWRNESQSADFMSGFGSVEAVRILTEGPSWIYPVRCGYGMWSYWLNARQVSDTFLSGTSLSSYRPEIVTGFCGT